MLTAATRVAGLIGDPVGHSLSPLIHNAAFQAVGLDWVYVAFEVQVGAGADAVSGMRALHIDGLSVTMPHKEVVLEAVDRVSNDVAALGAANTIVRIGSELCAHTTDGDGFVDALRANGLEPAGIRCMVVGAGGAGRAVVRALSIAGAAEIAVVNRDDARAAKAIQLGGPTARRAHADEAGDFALIINATPLGMGGERSVPIDVARIGPGQVVNDLIYHPLVTPLLRAATAQGARVIGGLGMLIHQAARQFQLWTGEAAPIAAMQAAVEAELTRRAVAAPSA